MLPRSSALDDLDRGGRGKRSKLPVTRLTKAGARGAEVEVQAFDRQGEYFKDGGFAGAEAYHIHRANLERLGEYDPRVGKRVVLGRDMTAADYVRARRAARGVHPRGRGARRALRRDPDADRAVHRADHRRSRARATRSTSAGTSASCAIPAWSISSTAAPRRALPCAGPSPARRPDGVRRRREPTAARWRSPLPLSERSPPEIDRRGGAPALRARRGAATPVRRGWRPKSPRACSSAWTTSSLRRGASSTPAAARRGEALERRYPNAQVLALDFSLAMLPAARVRVRSAGARRVSRLRATSRGCRWRAARVDLAWCNMALHWVSDPLAAFDEFHRVSRAGRAADVQHASGRTRLKELRAPRRAGARARLRRHARPRRHAGRGGILRAGDGHGDASRSRTRPPARCSSDLRASGQTSARADRPRGMAAKALCAAPARGAGDKPGHLRNRLRARLEGARHANDACENSACFQDVCLEAAHSTVLFLQACRAPFRIARVLPFRDGNAGFSLILKRNCSHLPGWLAGRFAALALARARDRHRDSRWRARGWCCRSRGLRCCCLAWRSCCTRGMQPITSASSSMPGA